MDKIRFFFLQILFLFTPLIYAWLYIPGISGDISDIVVKIFPHLRWSGFESVKVTFFLFCAGGAIVFHLGDSVLHKKYNLSQAFLLPLCIFFLWTFFSSGINRDINPYFFSGSPEKHHGWFMYGVLILIFFLVKGLSSLEQKKLMNMSLIGAVGVALYVLFQRLGLDPLTNSYQTRLDIVNRSFSTLGNPNYLAGLFLMVLPLIHERIRFRSAQYTISVKVILWILGGILVYWTGSYMAWILFPLGLLFFGTRSVFTTKKSQYIFWSLLALFLLVSALYIGAIYGSDILEMQKMKGFIARWFLWKTGLAAISHDVWHFFFGYGPDGFLAVSEHFRDPLLSTRYEDPAYRIDRSHNVFIDFALHFGVPLLMVLVGLIFQKFKYLSQGEKFSLIFFALYFSFNIPVLVHFLILLQIFSLKQKSTIHHK